MPNCASCSTGTRCDDIERQLQRLDAKYKAHSVDGVHDMLIALGDLTDRGDRGSHRPLDGRRGVRDADARRRVLTLRVAGELRHVAVEDAARYRDAPRRAAAAGRTRVAARSGAGSARRPRAPLRADARAVYRRRVRRLATACPPRRPSHVLVRLTGENRLLEGEFSPGGTRREWTDSRRAAHDPPPIAGDAAEGSGTGRPGRARPVRGLVAGRREEARAAPMRCST